MRRSHGWERLYDWVLQTQSKGRHCSQAEQFPGTAPPTPSPAQGRGSDGHTQMGIAVQMGGGMGSVTKMKINQGWGFAGVDSVSSTQLYFDKNLESQGL